MKQPPRSQSGAKFAIVKAPFMVLMKTIVECRNGTFTEVLAL